MVGNGVCFDGATGNGTCSCFKGWSGYACDQTVPCPAGYIRESKEGPCLPCSPGQYAPTGAASCLYCPKGSYNPHAGASSCVDCPRERYYTYDPKSGNAFQQITGALNLSSCILDPMVFRARCPEGGDCEDGLHSVVADGFYEVSPSHFSKCINSDACKRGGGPLPILTNHKPLLFRLKFSLKCHRSVPFGPCWCHSLRLWSYPLPIALCVP